jgi:Ni/Co efflux regulator RcnB
MTRNYWAMTCTTVMMALTVSTALAKQSAAGRNDRGRNRTAAHMNFDDNDRQATRTWYEAHQRNLPAGFRASDRLSPSVELQFQPGFVLDLNLRRQVHPVPSALLRQLAPAPRGYRYVIINEHVVLIDSGYRVSDVIHVGHNR